MELKIIINLCHDSLDPNNQLSLYGLSRQFKG